MKKQKRSHSEKLFNKKNLILLSSLFAVLLGLKIDKNSVTARDSTQNFKPAASLPTVDSESDDDNFNSENFPFESSSHLSINSPADRQSFLQFNANDHFIGADFTGSSEPFGSPDLGFIIE